MGRPPKPPEELRSHRVVTFLTEADWSALHRQAEVDGQSLSATAHRLLHLALSPRVRASNG